MRALNVFLALALAFLLGYHHREASETLDEAFRRAHAAGVAMRETGRAMAGKGARDE